MNFNDPKYKNEFSRRNNRVEWEQREDERRNLIRRDLEAENWFSGTPQILLNLVWNKATEDGIDNPDFPYHYEELANIAERAFNIGQATV